MTTDIRNYLVLATVLLAAILAQFLAGCSEWDKVTGSTATPATASTAGAQTLGDLSTLLFAAIKDYSPLLTGGNTRNGQDVANALFAQAATGEGATLAGQLITDYGGTALAPFASVVQNAISSGQISKTASASAILNTVAAVVQNVTNQNAIPLTTADLHTPNDPRALAKLAGYIRPVG